MKITPIAYKTNFSARHKNNVEKSPYSKNGELVHTSHFFRYDNIYKVNQTIGNYLKRTCNSSPINIVSMGCSYGEEVYSLAMTMNYYGLNSKINGFDISKQTIDEIHKGEYELSGYESDYLFSDYEYFPTQDAEDFRKGMRKEFEKNFDLISESFWKFQKRKGAFTNCSFFRGDAVNLSDYFKENSQDVISCCFVLYHLSDREKINTLKQIHSTLRPNGILCVSPTEEDMFSLIRFCGFEHVDFKHPWMFKKSNNQQRGKSENRLHQKHIF